MNRALQIDRFGSVLTLLAGLSLAFMPFLTLKPNRIAAGKGLFLWDLVEKPLTLILLVVLAAMVVTMLFVKQPWLRLGMAVAALMMMPLNLGLSAADLVEGSSAARVSIGGSFWALLALSLLLATDALLRLNLSVQQRFLALCLALIWLIILFQTPLLSDLSVMREYVGRSEQFWREAAQHVLLAFGSLFAALLIGLPLGLLCYSKPQLRQSVLQSLSLIQTIPSIALFGLLMVPLAWLAKTSPLAASLGIRGIGAAPALIALVLYALLPVVANVVVGLANVPKAVQDAALGMGFNKLQLMAKIDLPLALPVILTGIRVVLVQNIGLVTVAALIGGGGFGAFVFQGINQTATDLVLLGALPTVTLAFLSAIVLDMLVEITRKLPS